MTQNQQIDLWCDFCLEKNHASHRYSLRGAIFVDEDPNGVPQLDESDWLACPTCSLKIENRDIDGLLEGFNASFDELDRIGVNVDQMRANLRRRFVSFIFAHNERIDV